MPQHEYLISVCQLILAMSLAGSSVVVGKILISSLPVYLGTFLTLLVALICMLPLMHSRYDEVKKLSAREWLYLFLQGLCGIVLFRIFTLYGLMHTGALQAGIITGTTPAILAILSLILLKERLSMRSITGIFFAVGGCVLINATTKTETSGNALLGCSLVGLAVVCEALFTIFRKRIASTVSATTNTTILIFCSLILLFIPALADLVILEHFPSHQGWLAVVYYGVFATVIAYLLWTSAVAKVDGATAGTTTAAMPASSVILAALLLGEQIYWQHLAGCFLVCVGILVTTTRKKKENTTIISSFSAEIAKTSPTNSSGQSRLFK